MRSCGTLLAPRPAVSGQRQFDHERFDKHRLNGGCRVISRLSGLGTPSGARDARYGLSLGG